MLRSSVSDQTAAPNLQTTRFVIFAVQMAYTQNTAMSIHLDRMAFPKE